VYLGSSFCFCLGGEPKERHKKTIFIPPIGRLLSRIVYRA
jgi:hypothetical protein